MLWNPKCAPYSACLSQLSHGEPEASQISTHPLCYVSGSGSTDASIGIIGPSTFAMPATMLTMICNTARPTSGSSYLEKWDRAVRLDGAHDEFRAFRASVDGRGGMGRARARSRLAGHGARIATVWRRKVEAGQPGRRKFTGAA